MPPRLAWADLRTARVGVWGLGVEGRAAVARLRAMGVEPMLVDDAPAGETFQGLPVAVTAHGGLEHLRLCDVVVKSPGISRYRTDAIELVAQGVALVGGMGLWMEEVDAQRVVGVTGTKGKSTTTSIIGHLLQRLGYDCFLGGNLGAPPFAPEAGAEHDYWVVELSSYQVTDLASAPAVVVVTSLHPDHLNWHAESVEQYYSDKLRVCSLPGARVTVADATNADLRRHVAQLGSAVRWVEPPAQPSRAWSAALGLHGAHNVRNAALARQVLVELGIGEAGDDEAMQAAAAGFQPLQSRLTSIGMLDGIEFIDDSLSTNVLPTIAAVESFAERPLALLVGGYDRGIDYQDLAAAVAGRRLPTVLIGLPDNGPQIVELVCTAACSHVEVATAPTVADATAFGYAWLRQRGLTGVVVLSPAAASFSQFHDYRERARAFADAMDALRAQ